MSAKTVGLTKININEQTLAGIMGRMPAAKWKQWAKELPTWMHGEVSLAFERFIDQRRRKWLNIVAEESCGFLQ
jgi:hypothetical protein